MVLCFCGRLAIVKTSWTDLNPGRRFYACPIKGFVCGFVGWVDTPMCARAKQIILGLLRNINRLERNAFKLKMYLIGSWIIFFIVLLLSI